MRVILGRLQKMAQRDSADWLCAAARLLLTVQRYEEFVQRLRELLSPRGKAEMIAILRRLKMDESTNEYCYGTFQDDDDCVTVVSGVAAKALVCLGCAREADLDTVTPPTPKSTIAKEIDRLKGKLEAQRDLMGPTVFGHVAKKLPTESEIVLWRVLGGSSFEEIVEAVAISQFHISGTGRPTETEIAAAKAKTIVVLNEIASRYQLILRLT
jgi:hypothetical protein